MYESFYGLKEKPFSMLPDPGFLYLSKKHTTALTLLEYALYNKAGFCVISGDIGAGKTTLLRKLLESMHGNIKVGMITNTHKSFGELLDWVLSAFAIPKTGLNKVEMQQAFVEYLLEQYAKNKTTLLIVDEAQNMPVETLEELRMLSNINSEKDQLLQVILAGQPDLKETLKLPELKQFAQRISVDYHLGPLDLEETFGYIQHRLRTAVATQDIFSQAACELLYDYSGGVPRLINLMCDTAMVYGFADQATQIDANLIDEMVRERMQGSLVPFASAEQVQARQQARRESGNRCEFPSLTLASNTPPPTKGEADTTTASVEADSAQPGAPASATRLSEQTQAQQRKKRTRTAPAPKAVPQDSTAPAPEMVTAAPSHGRSETQHAATAVAEAAPAVPEHRPVVAQDKSPQPVTSAATNPRRWGVAAAVAGVVLIAVLVFGLTDSDEDPAPVPAPIPADVQQQLDEADVLKRRLVEMEQQEKTRREADTAAAMQREQQEQAQREAEQTEAAAQQRERGRIEALEQQAKQLKQERDRALAKAAAEQAAGEKKALEANREAARARALELEQVRIKAQAEAAQQAAIKANAERKAAQEASVQASPTAETQLLPAAGQNTATPLADDAATGSIRKNADADLGFKTEPCSGPAARFLSTCRN
jgi:type II secretory pathway predicted ATPase ExeA